VNRQVAARKWTHSPRKVTQGVFFRMAAGSINFNRKGVSTTTTIEKFMEEIEAQIEKTQGIIALLKRDVCQ